MSRYYLMLLIFFLMAGSSLHSQIWLAESDMNGFILKKVTSDTTIATGQPFSYTIYFTIPAGATDVTIFDNLPSSLMFLGYSVTNACGTPTSESAPAVNSMGGTVSVNWANVPTGCSGSITITVAFPNGITCNGAGARNNVCLTGTVGELPTEFCTPYVSTTAIAENPWQINKYPAGVAWQGGSCQYLTASDTIKYNVNVFKSVGTTGQLNLVNGVVTDVLPAGAVLLSSTCGATQTGNVITWNVGNLTATTMYSNASCQFVIYFPSSIFPNGSTISNTAVLSGELGREEPSCDTFEKESNTTCVEKTIVTSGILYKYVYTNRQAGCAGQYVISVCNNGTTSLPVDILDTLPSNLDNYDLLYANGGLTATITSGVLSITGTLAPGNCASVSYSFDIPASTADGTLMKNCAWMFIPNGDTLSACATFVVEQAAPKICLWKDVCDKESSYEPGSIVRYRLRIQNIGGVALTGATITDALDPNLEYVGNPSYYISNTWNVSCTSSPANPWSGVSLSYDASTNTITGIIDSIPSVCQTIYYNACGMYGTSGVPFYFIEIDVKVRDTAALGNIPNMFMVSGGSFGAAYQNSNTDYILVSGVVGYNLEKGIKKSDDSSYGTSVNTSPGSTVDYKLKMNSSGTAALRHVTFVDLLPMNDNTNDGKILNNCAPRGSQFDIMFNSLIGTSPSVASYWDNTATNLADVNSWTPTGAPGDAFTIGCGTDGTWSSSSWAVPQKNLGAYFGDVAMGTSGAEIEFSAFVSESATLDQTACNTFAVSGWTKHLIQSSLATYQRAGELESGAVCATISEDKEPEGCIEVLRFDIRCGKKDPKGLQQYIINLAANSCTPATILFGSPDGSFSPASFTFTSSPWSLSTVFTSYTGNNPITVYYTLMCGDTKCTDTLEFKVPVCDSITPIDECCAKFIHNFGKYNLTSNNTTGYVGLETSLMAGPSPIKKFTATIVNAQLRRACRINADPWTRIYGDITGGVLNVAPAPGPQLLDVFSREAIWGAGECVDWTKGAHLRLDMLFPPFSGGVLCTDTLKFQIRYSFTDCDCNTCDTIVSYTVIRRPKLLPWTDVKDVLIGIRGFNADAPSATSVVMTNNNEGKFWVISPDDEENDVTIKGVEIQSLDVNLIGLSHNGTNGVVQGDVSFINMDIARGQSADIDLRFDNNQSLMQFPILVRFLYTTKGSDEVYYTDQITYMARVPDANSDDMGVDTDVKPENVKTYALYFRNANGYEQDVSAISINPAKELRVLAVGPANAEGESTYIAPKRQSDDSYLISTLINGEIGIAPKELVSPIFITISGVTEDNNTVEYSTYDDNGEVITSGTFELHSPIAKVIDVNGNIDVGIEINSIIPNPASSTITVTISSEKVTKGAKMGIFDALGREIIPLDNNLTLIEQGQHILSFDISNLVNGMYFFTIQTPDGIVSAPLSVVK